MLPWLTWESWPTFSGAYRQVERCGRPPTTRVTLGGHAVEFCLFPTPVPTFKLPFPPAPFLHGFSNHIWLPSELQLLKRTKADRDGGSTQGGVAAQGGWLSLPPHLFFEHNLNTWYPPKKKSPSLVLEAQRHKGPNCLQSQRREGTWGGFESFVKITQYGRRLATST